MRNVTVYRVRAGALSRDYSTEYHAEQLVRALRLNGMTPTVTAIRLPNDALTLVRALRLNGMTPTVTAIRLPNDALTLAKYCNKTLWEHEA